MGKVDPLETVATVRFAAPRISTSGFALVLYLDPPILLPECHGLYLVMPGPVLS
jgi:hypothetical protein